MIYSATLCMYEVIKAGGLIGGFNFNAKNRRADYTYEDMFYGFILGMDIYNEATLDKKKESFANLERENQALVNK